jgi:RNA polymerase subunit RPABC4/transcription elongation factor Spt4
VHEATCPNCGATVDEDANDRCPECDGPLKVTCPSCGARVPEDAEECPQCGSSLSHASDGA